MDHKTNTFGEIFPADNKGITAYIRRKALCLRKPGLTHIFYYHSISRVVIKKIMCAFVRQGLHNIQIDYISTWIKEKG